MFASMRTLNEAPIRLAEGLELHGCTDVTGFGLIGHACEMAEGSGVQIELASGAVPLFDQVLDMARLGIIPAGSYRNQDFFGLVDGLLKMSADNAQGGTMTFTGVPPGGWFGEGTALKREPYRYNIQALRKSRVAGLPLDTFHWLLDHSLGFNRFVMNQLNERLAQFIATIEADRTPNPEQRVARNLAALANPVLFPGVGDLLRITQQELAYLVGLSRQRVNEALKALAAQGLLQIEYGGLRILDLPALRHQTF